MNITNHPCPSFGKGGDTVQTSYTYIIICIFSLNISCIHSFSWNVPVPYSLYSLFPLLLIPFTPNLIICPLTSSNFP